MIINWEERKKFFSSICFHLQIVYYKQDEMSIKFIFQFFFFLSFRSAKNNNNKKKGKKNEKRKTPKEKKKNQ